MNNKYVYLFLLMISVALYSCQKLPGHAIQPGSGSSGSTGSTSGSGGSTGGAIDTTKGYMPTTAGSYAKYKSVTGSLVNTSINTMTGNTTTINGKLYSVCNVNSVTYGNSVGYFSNINHVYTERATTVMAGITVELEYLVDNVAVGATWTAPVTDVGTINGVPARLVGTIAEKNITKTVEGTTFKSVIHTTLQLQYDYGMGFETDAVYDYYIAKGVGLIEADAVVSYNGIVITTSKATLISFSIK